MIRVKAGKSWVVNNRTRVFNFVLILKWWRLWNSKIYLRVYCTLRMYSNTLWNWIKVILRSKKITVKIVYYFDYYESVSPETINQTYRRESGKACCLSWIYELPIEELMEGTQYFIQNRIQAKEHYSFQAKMESEREEHSVFNQMNYRKKSCSLQMGYSSMQPNV